MADEQNRQIFIRNIPYDVDENELADWCATFGSISGCRLKRDKDGQSRGFAFVTYASMEGHNNILSRRPHTCKGRLLLVKNAMDQTQNTDSYSRRPNEQFSRSTSHPDVGEDFSYQSMESVELSVDDDQTHLGSLRDELEANLECLKIQHEHEINVLHDKLEREKKHRDEAEQMYQEAKEDWSKCLAENLRLRTSTIKNVVQTFNIRRDLGRRTKDLVQQCTLMNDDDGRIPLH